MRLIVFLLFCSLGSCTRAPTAEQIALVADIESRVTLPKGAGSLKCYERYYAIAVDEYLPGKRVVKGSYVVGKKPGVYWVDSEDKFPDRNDAGCGKLGVFYIMGDRTIPVEATCSPTFAGTIDDVVDPPVTC